MDVNKLLKGFTINPCRLHNTGRNNPSFSLHLRVVTEDVAVAGVVAADITQVVISSSNLLNDTQYHVIFSQTLD